LPMRHQTAGQAYEKLDLVDQHWVLRGEVEVPPEAEGVSLVPAVDKSVRILKLLNGYPAGLTLAEIVRATGVTKSHGHGILRTLCDHDWLLFDAASKRYRLYVGIARDLSGALDEELPMRELLPTLDLLSEEAGTSCVLSKPLPDGGFLVVDKRSASNNVEISYPMGFRLPADASAHMRANLAWRSGAEVDRQLARITFHKHTAETIVGEAAVRAELEETRQRGYARSVGEFTEGVMAVALPVFNRKGEVAFTLDCVGTVPSMLPREAAIAGALQRAVGRLHQRLGSQLPAGYPPAASRG
jgi:DNA-binding IclR family transcriptional regulator